MNRRTVAEIHLGNIAANLRRVKQIAKNSTVIGVVKADAYGHGAVRVSKKLIESGIDALGVACIEEAAELREAGIKERIVVFFDNDHIDSYFKYDFEPVIFEVGAIEKFSQAARNHGKEIAVHLKIDTGMGRVGFLLPEVEARVSELLGSEGVRLKGIMSHFSEADLSDRAFAQNQLQEFTGLLGRLRARGISVEGHIANSAAVIALPESHLDAIRPGLMLYGYSPFGTDQGLLPAMKLRTNIISVRKVPPDTPISYGRTFVTKKPSVIGVIAAGYADGYSRAFSNNAEVLIRDRNAPVVGRVCMDLTMVDLTGISGVHVGDEAVLMLRRNGSGMGADDLAKRINTISYELLTSLGSRARKEYIDG